MINEYSKSLGDVHDCLVTFSKHETGSKTYYRAEFPNFEGCMALEEATFEEAKRRAKIACSLWILGAKEAGIDIPKPDIEEKLNVLLEVTLAEYEKPEQGVMS